MRPETRYARGDDVNIAYQVVGEGRGTHALKGVPGEWHLFAVGKDTQS